MNTGKIHGKIEKERIEKEQIRSLVVSGSYTADFINTKLFNSKEVPEFRQWSNDTLFLGMACLAVTYAKALKLPSRDFVALIREAYDMLDAEEKPSGTGD